MFVLLLSKVRVSLYMVYVAPDTQVLARRLKLNLKNSSLVSVVPILQAEEWTPHSPDLSPIVQH